MLLTYRFPSNIGKSKNRKFPLKCMEIKKNTFSSETKEAASRETKFCADCNDYYADLLMHSLRYLVAIPEITSIWLVPELCTLHSG